MTVRRHRWVWVLVILILLGCIALAGTAGALVWIASRTAGTSGTPTPVVSGSTSVPGGSQADIDLRLVADPPTTLDPAMVEDSASAEYVDKIFSGLVGLDENLSVVPEVADHWELSADGTVYTFYLRSNAYFQDGAKVTAQDVKFSIERACDPATGSRVAGTYLGDIVGAIDKLSGAAQDVRGVEVIDNSTVRITIREPRASFLAKLTYPTAYLVESRNVGSGSAWWHNPVGTGPFSLSNWDQSELVLQRNDRYYGETGGVKTATYVLSSGSPVTMYEAGELDAAPVGTNDIERVLDPVNPLHFEIHVTPQLYTQYVGFNVQMAPFDDPMVRKAFALATNKQAIAEVYFKKMRAPASGILPPGMPGYNSDLLPIPFDPAAAQAALAQSRYGSAANLPPITLTVTGLGETNSFAKLLAGMYQEVLGVNLEVEQVDWSTYLDELNGRQYQMFTLAWNADYPDPENFLETQFYSTSDLNSTGYSNPQVDALLEQARTETDTQVRFGLYQQAEQIIVNDAPWIPLFHGVDYTLIKPYLSGLTVTPQGNYFLDKTILATQ